MNISKQVPRCHEMLNFPWRLVVVPLDEMDGLASQSFSIRRHVPGAAETEVSEEVERIVRFHTGIHALQNRLIHLIHLIHLVHLVRVGKRTLAETNDVEVPQMKVGREPNVSHHPSYLRNRSAPCD
jgi:hypothetical protein